VKKLREEVEGGTSDVVPRYLENKTRAGSDGYFLAVRLCKEHLTPSIGFFTFRSAVIEETAMSFKEKSAWIIFISTLIAALSYFTALALSFTGYVRYSSVLHLFAALMIGLLVVQVVAHAIMAARAPAEAKIPTDERERIIGWKSDRVGYYTLIAGALLGIVTIHLGASASDIAHAVLLAFVLSQLAKYGTVVRLHRRDVA
jgi:hypothetical protein